MATKEKYFNSARQMLQLYNGNGDRSLAIQVKPYPHMAHVVALNLAIVPIDGICEDVALRTERWDDAIGVSLDIYQMMTLIYALRTPVQSQWFKFDNTSTHIKSMSVTSESNGRATIYLSEMVKDDTMPGTKCTASTLNFVLPSAVARGIATALEGKLPSLCFPE